MLKRFELKGGTALYPLFLFLTLFIGSGLYFTFHQIPYAFYKISPTVAILPALLLAIFMGRGEKLKNLDSFLEGVRDKNILTMCMIYLLAGAFTELLKSVGGVDATVRFALDMIPADATLPGLFILAAFISTAMGTSMGTIAAVGPIAFGVADHTGLSLPIVMGAVIGGAMFGDNLSMISDTTIAAVSVHPCSLKDKFKINAKIVLGPMLLTVFLLIFLGYEKHPLIDQGPQGYNIWLTAPYLLVLCLALLGLNVFLVLSTGILVALLTGFCVHPDFSFVKASEGIFKGYTSMQEIFILSLLIGGLSHLAKVQGGIDFLIQATERWVKRFARTKSGSRVAEVAVSALASLCDIFTANNTIAIILSGGPTEAIVARFHVARVRAAVFVDTFSCVFQGILPYSAQVLLAGSIAHLSPLEIIPHVYYCYFLGISASLAIFFRWPKVPVSQ